MKSNKPLQNIWTVTISHTLSSLIVSSPPRFNYFSYYLIPPYFQSQALGHVTLTPSVIIYLIISLFISFFTALGIPSVHHRILQMHLLFVTNNSKTHLIMHIIVSLIVKSLSSMCESKTRGMQLSSINMVIPTDSRCMTCTSTTPYDQFNHKNN